MAKSVLVAINTIGLTWKDKDVSSHVGSVCKGRKAAGPRLDSQESRSWTGETQRQKRETIRDSESIRRRASHSQHSPVRERQSIRASCRSEGTFNKPHRQVLQPLLCLRPPRLKRGWGWLILTGFMWAGSRRGMEMCKKVLMSQQLSLTRAQHKHLATKVCTHTHSSIHPNAPTPTPLNVMSVWNRGEEWGSGCSQRRGAYPKSGPIKHLKIKSHCSYRGAIQRRYLCR